MEKVVSGACYVSDVSVLDTATLEPPEIDYLLAQTLFLPQKQTSDGTSEGYNAMALMQSMKLMLAASAVLSRKLKDPKLDLDDIVATADKLGKLQETVKKEFDKLPPYKAEDNDPTKENGVKIKDAKGKEVSEFAIFDNMDDK